MFSLYARLHLPVTASQKITDRMQKHCTEMGVNLSRIRIARSHRPRLAFLKIEDGESDD